MLFMLARSKKVAISHWKCVYLIMPYSGFAIPQRNSEMMETAIKMLQ